MATSEGGKRANFVIVGVALLWANAVVIGWALAWWFGAREPVQTVLQGLVILNIPLIGLFAIFRDARFRYALTPNASLNAIVWFGWMAALVVGLVTVVYGLILV